MHSHLSLGYRPFSPGQVWLTLCFIRNIRNPCNANLGKDHLQGQHLLITSGEVTLSEDICITVFSLTTAYEFPTQSAGLG